MKKSIKRWVEADINVGEILDDMTDDDLKQFGLRRTGGIEKNAVAIMRAIYEHHEKSHQTNSMVACPTEPCTSLSTSEVWSIEEARASRWGQN